MNERKHTLEYGKNRILSIPQKEDLRLIKHYRGITVSVVAENNHNGYRESRFTETQILQLRSLVDRITSKNLQAIHTFVDFRKYSTLYTEVS